MDKKYKYTKHFSYSKYEGEIEKIPQWVVWEMAQEIKKDFFKEVGVWCIVTALIPTFLLLSMAIHYAI